MSRTATLTRPTSPSGESGKHPGCIRMSIWMPVELHRQYLAVLAERASNQSLDVRRHVQQVVAKRKAAVTIKVDCENGADEWWAAARVSTTTPKFLRAFFADFAEKIVVTAEQAKLAKAWCASLPGWHGGPEYVRNPLLFVEND